MRVSRLPLFILVLLSPLLSTVAQVTNVVPSLSVDDTYAILDQKGNEIEVYGTVLEAFWVRKRTLLITFRPEHDGFLAVAFAKDRKELDAAFGGDLIPAIKGKGVRIRGTVSLHNERPQIVISRPEQLTLDETAKTP